MRHYIGEKFVTVMLVNRRKFVIYFLFDSIRRHYGLIPFLFTASALIASFALPHVLVEFGEGQRKPEGIAYTFYIFELAVFAHKKMHFELIYGDKALEAGVQITEVGVVLEAY
jgi:hypothetical protein